MTTGSTSSTSVQPVTRDDLNVGTKELTDLDSDEVSIVINLLMVLPGVQV